MLINARIYCKIIDRLNISIIILILFLTFISLSSQRKWTILYSSMIDIRNKNNNIIDYISKTEEYFLDKIDYRDNIKKTNPDDLIYVQKTEGKERVNFLSSAFKEMIRGFNDGRYQKGY